MAAIAAACQQEELVPEMPQASSEDYTASVESFESQTKTSMTSEKYVVWSQNDRLAIFQGSTLADEYKVTDASVGNANGTFSIVNDASDINGDFSAGTELPCNVAIYPYATGLTLTGAALEDEGTAYKVEGVVLPAEQTYAESSFANGAFPMVAVTETLSDHNLKFKNVLGALKLRLKGTQTVKSITVKGRNNEKLSGAATVTAYANNLAPAITMTATDEASKSVTLNCGEGVQLSEGAATDFIIALPPVLFTNGFTVTVTADESETYTITADVANTVLRSSILTMPAIILGDEPENGDADDATYIEYLFLDKTSLTMYPETSYTLVADIDPVEVTYPTLTWSSSDETVAKVDQTGKITTVSDGTATITALAVGGVNASCTVKVKSAQSVTVKNYVVDGNDYGKGINIGGTVWAPVNCGYEPVNGDYKGYPYGKLYQWGRKYGQGYSTYYDATEPEIVEGPVMPSVGKSEDNKDVFYKVTTSPYDWCSVQLDDLWAGENGAKTSSDPCPDGWRVPTNDELSALSDNYSSWTANAEGQDGYYFVGEYTYMDGIPQVFFPAAGYRNYDGDADDRGNYGYYWSSEPNGRSAYYLYFRSSYVGMGSYYRAIGFSVRCVQVID